MLDVIPLFLYTDPYLTFLLLFLLMTADIVYVFSY